MHHLGTWVSEIYLKRENMCSIGDMAPFQLRQAVVRFLVKSGWSLPVAPCQSSNRDGPGCSGREFAVIIFPQDF